MSQPISEIAGQMIALIPLELILNKYANTNDRLGAVRYEGVRWDLTRKCMRESHAKNLDLADLCIGAVSNYERPGWWAQTVDELRQPFLTLRDSHTLEDRFAIHGIKEHARYLYFLRHDLTQEEDQDRKSLFAETNDWLKEAPFYDLAALGEELASSTQGQQSLERMQAGYERLRDHRLRMMALYGRTE